MVSFGVAGWGPRARAISTPLRAGQGRHKDRSRAAIARVDASRLTQTETTSEPPALQPKSGARSTDGITSLGSSVGLPTFRR
jgi:hypothetical protein